MDAYIGQVVMFTGSFAPRGWALCDGTVLAIATNTALFSILGTTYGGNGRTTFALPDLRGRSPVHVGGSGPGPGLSPYSLGEIGGVENVNLVSSQMPMHNHNLACASAVGAARTPVNNFVAGDSGGDLNYSPTANAVMNPASIGFVGGNQPHTNIQPYLTINFIIAMQGIFPPRN